MDIKKFINKNSCFDLQFRRDIKYNRPAKPVYYSWKAQFVIMGKITEEDLLRAIKDTFDCGKIHFVLKNKIRYSVQSIDDLNNKVVPYFEKNKLSGNKKNDFEWWAKSIKILFENKGKKTKEWQKQDFIQMIEIHKEMQKYKVKKIKPEKWLSIAESIFPPA